MKTWMIAIVASAAVAASMPVELTAQGRSSRGRQQSQTQEQIRERMRQAQQRAEAQRERERQQQRQTATIRRDDDRYDRTRRDRDRYDDRWDRRDNDRRWDDRRDDRYNRNGPAFCRSGEGHPVFGRQWCRDKGYGLGRDRSRDIWGDIIYRQPRDRRYDNRTLSRGTLGDILGSVVLGRFDSYGRTYYGNGGTLNGRWLDSRGSTLQLFMGGVPIARLIDTNFDGRVDNVILAR